MTTAKLGGGEGKMKPMSLKMVRALAEVKRAGRLIEHGSGIWCASDRDHHLSWESGWESGDWHHSVTVLALVRRHLLDVVRAHGRTRVWPDGIPYVVAYPEDRRSR